MGLLKRFQWCLYGHIFDFDKGGSNPACDKCGISYEEYVERIDSKRRSKED